jgi:hypothetical protein
MATKEKYLVNEKHKKYSKTTDKNERGSRFNHRQFSDGKQYVCCRRSGDST